ncbi:hypothetical protein [Roseibium sp.]|uniref:hypothetical protein n=1 Tax=Roseibium sp. TaxID=1936156 RepID=UPI003D0A71C3
MPVVPLPPDPKYEKRLGGVLVELGFFPMLSREQRIWFWWDDEEMKCVALRVLVLSLLVLGTAAIGSNAHASSCWRPSPAEHIDRMPIVFFGKVINAPRGPADGKVQIAEFRVQRAYKGVTGDTVTIGFLNDHGGNRGWGFDRGSSMLVFAESSNPYLELEVKADGYAYFCSMIPYFGRTALHPEYWDILALMKP